MSRLSDLLLGLRYLFLFNFDKNAIVQQLKHERDILNILAVMPVKYTCKQVEKALKASHATPDMIYTSLAAGEPTLVLEQFYAALRVSDGEEELRREGWNGDEAW